MKFEKIFEDDLDNYLFTITNKIKKISDFNIIFELIDIKALENKKKYLELLKSKYNISIKSSELSEKDESLIKSLTNITSFICENDGKIDFLEKTIAKSAIINKTIKHKIYLELIKYCKEKNNEEIKKFIELHYKKPDNLNEFIDFLVNLTEEDANDFIENLDNKYIIIEKEFYSSGESLNIKLFNLINKNLTLKEDNNYLKSNIKTLEKIAKDIDEKEIKFEYLSNFCKNLPESEYLQGQLQQESQKEVIQKKIIMEKLNALTFIPDLDVNPDTTFENIKKFYKDMIDTLDELSNCKRSLEKYHQEIKKEEISTISLNIETIRKETYNNFHKGRANIQILLEGCSDIISKINEIKDSKIFNIFYKNINKNEKYKNNKTTSLFDQAYEEFTKFKQLLIKEGADIINKNSNQDEMIKKIKEQYQEDKIIKNELSSLIKGEKKNEEELMIILNSKNIERDLNSLLTFFSYLINDENNENVNEDLKNEWKEWKEKCQDFSKKKDNSEIKSILEDLKKNGIYDYKENIEIKSNYIILFNIFDENELALDFLNKHTAEDVKHLYDKIEPGKGNLKMSDIDDTFNCVGFFQELKEIKGGMKEIIKHIIKKLNNDSNILKRFKNYSVISRHVDELNKNFDFSQNIYKEIQGIIKDSKFFLIKLMMNSMK